MLCSVQNAVNQLRPRIRRFDLPRQCSILIHAISDLINLIANLLRQICISALKRRRLLSRVAHVTQNLRCAWDPQCFVIVKSTVAERVPSGESPDRWPDQVFLVVWVDLEREVVDLIPIGGRQTVEENVPFTCDSPGCTTNVSTAIEEFLAS